MWWAHKAHPATYLAHMDVLMGTAFDRLPALDCPQAARWAGQGEAGQAIGRYGSAGIFR